MGSNPPAGGLSDFLGLWPGVMCCMHLNTAPSSLVSASLPEASPPLPVHMVQPPKPLSPNADLRVLCSAMQLRILGELLPVQKTKKKGSWSSGLRIYSRSCQRSAPATPDAACLLQTPLKGRRFQGKTFTGFVVFSAACNCG